MNSSAWNSIDAAAPGGSSRFWFAVSMLLVVVVAMALRLGTQILHKPFVFDEAYITQPIVSIIEHGWSMRTAIDFEETKGPGLIWLYAVAGEVVGSSLNDLRLISMLLFIAGAIPLLDIARRCGLTGRNLVAVGGLYVLLPYHAVLGQLVMSEASFVACATAACWILVWAMDDRPLHADEVARHSTHVRGIIAPMAFAVMLSILLHNRVHAVALAAAVSLVAIERLGWRGSLPWLIACAAAGISRIPLWLHWGGLVSPRYQGVHGLGWGGAGSTYMLAAFAPMLAVFIVAAMRYPGHRWFIVIGGAVGLLLAITAMPSLAESERFEDLIVLRFSGVVATAIRTISSQWAIQAWLIGLLATIGGSGLGALTALAWRREVNTTAGLVAGLQSWSLLAGFGVSAASAAPVYDRYPLAWTMLLPILWKQELPRWALVVQSVALLGMAAYLCSRWLM